MTCKKVGTYSTTWNSLFNFNPKYIRLSQTFHVETNQMRILKMYERTDLPSSTVSIKIFVASLEHLRRWNSSHNSDFCIVR